VILFLFTEGNRLPERFKKKYPMTPKKVQELQPPVPQQYIRKILNYSFAFLNLMGSWCSEENLLEFRLTA